MEFPTSYESIGRIGSHLAALARGEIMRAQLWPDLLA
jgi:hypothetical protein